jgi:hypothetical protein
MRRLPSAAIALMLAVMTAWPSGVMAQGGEQCFSETNVCVSGPFLQYWRTNGGLPVFGFPITAARPEVNRDTGETYTTQWFERNRFELHGDRVLLGRLGDDRLRQLGIDWQAQPPAPERPECLYFEQTGHNVCDQTEKIGFVRYYVGHGLNDPALDEFGRSLALFGLPLTEARPERNAAGDTVLTQWFERARFEWHPNNPDAFKVLLGLLGREVGPPATTPAPATPRPAPGPVPSSCPGLAAPTGPGIQVAAAVSNRSPQQRADVTVCGLIVSDGRPMAGVPMLTSWRYRSSTASCNGVSDANGLAACTRSIGGATAGYAVTILVVFIVDRREYPATTSFTPQ